MIDICKTPIEILATDGYIISPNYPNGYQGRLYCNVNIRRNQNRLNDRIEIYLIKLSTEKTSLLSGNPTDYLEINKRNNYFGKVEYQVIYNDTQEANLVFKTDNFFNKGGFLLYYKSKKIN